MRLAVAVIVVANLIVGISNSSTYRNALGHCEPLTVEVVAGLVTKEARHLLDPGLKPSRRYLRFDLYTRRNPFKRQRLRTNDRTSLLGSNFNASWPVRFTIHGWTGMTTTCSNAAIKDAYLDKGDYNVILVDWSDYSMDINYFRVVFLLYEIGHQINAFARFLHAVHGIRYEDMYLIGHSAGSHIAGVAGKLLKPDRYGVIYALDSAGPVHRRLNTDWRVTPGDALYVESIQTDVSLFGYVSSNLGHASFYPNWGLGQPHCPNVTVMEPDFTCDHFGSLYFFVESLQNSKAFGAIRCPDYGSIEKLKCGCSVGHRCPADVFMGGDPAVPKRGVFYLSTRSAMPFGYGEVCRIKRPREPTAARLN